MGLTTNQNERPKLTKQYLVVFILSKLVDQLLDCPLLPQNNPGVQDKYPFVTYKMIDPHHDTTGDHRPDQLDCTIQLDAHSNDQFQANDMAEKLRWALINSTGYRNYFTQAYIVPREASIAADVQDHTVTLYGTNYDQDFGFDITFQISRADKVYQDTDLKFEFSEPIIKSIRANGNADGKNTSIDEKGGK